LAVCILQLHLVAVWLALERRESVPLSAAQLIEHEITRNLQQPRRELRSRNVAVRAFPHADEYLLGNILHVGVVPEHSPDRAGDQCLVPFDKPFERLHVACRDHLHQPDVLGVAFGRARGRWIFAGHYSVIRRSERLGIST
jgi:hypothetical protein